MRKRPSRPQRFVALDNGSVDTLKSMTAKGLLATLIRAKDGDDVTVEGLCKTHVEGREMLTKAMRALVEDAFVVKFKIQRKASETITLEDGSTEQRRGGSWWTTFTVDSIPFTADDVTVMLQEIFDDGNGNVKAVRVEPARLDRRERASDPPAPTDGKPSVGATCGNDRSPLDEGEEVLEDSGPRPTDGFPTVGGPTVGPSAAHIRKKTSSAHTKNEKTGDVPSARSAVDERSSSTTGSSAREAEGGSAASSNDHPSPKPKEHRPQAVSKTSSRAKHTREQLDLVRAVRAHFPSDLLAAPLPDVPALSQTILDALAGDVPAADRTVKQLGARIQQRWNEHGWASKFYAGEIDSLVGAAVAMVRPLKATDRYGCGNPRCDAGKDVDTGVECHVCPERLAARQKARRGEAQRAAGGANTPSADAGTVPAAPVPAQRDSLVLHTSVARRECAEDTCALPLPADWDDELCPKCRKRADRAAEAYRRQQEAADRYEAPEEAFASSGPAPF